MMVAYEIVFLKEPESIDKYWLAIKKRYPQQYSNIETMK